MKSKLFDGWDTETQYKVRKVDWILVVLIWMQNKNRKEKVLFT